MHQVLHPPGQGLVGQGHHAGRRLPLGHLPGQVRSGQHAGRDAGKDLGDDLGHPEVGPGLDALGQADDGLDRQRRTAASSSTARNPCEGTAMNTTPAPRSASSSEDVAASPSGRLHAGQIGRVLPGALDGGRELGRARPQGGRDARPPPAPPRPCPTNPRRRPPPGRSSPRAYGGGHRAALPRALTLSPSARQRHCLDRRSHLRPPSIPRARSRAHPGQGVPAGQAAPRRIDDR